MATTLFTQNTIACIWDFDKTLIPDYMQSPLFRRYGIDEATFWEETNKLAEHYRKRGYHLSPEIAYLNHLLTYVLAGPLAGLNNKILTECGAEIKFYQGLPEFFDLTKKFVREKPEYAKHEISVEHYIVSTGIAPMVRGSAIAKHVEGVWACEFVENPLQPGFLKQKELGLEAAEAEIAGVDFDVLIVPFKSLQVSLAYAYVDPEYKKWDREYPSGSGAIVDFSGAPFVYIPKHSFTNAMHHCK